MHADSVESYRDLKIWQERIEPCMAVYQVTRGFPADERFGLTSQLRRASVSVPSNIAEGYGRLTREQYRHFLRVARGSNLEVQTQLVLARELGFATGSEIEAVESVSIEIGKMLTSLLRKL